MGFFLGAQQLIFLGLYSRYPRYTVASSYRG